MDSAIAGLIGAVIGACVVILNSFISNRHQLNLEKEKSRLTQQAELSKELRDQIANVAQAMLLAQHSMEWVCWYAKEGSNVIDNSIISNYHREIHDCFPKLLGYLTVVASLDKNAYEKLASLAEKIYEIDSKIAKASVANKNEPEALSASLAECYPAATALYRTLPLEITKIMSASQSDTGGAI